MEGKHMHSKMFFSICFCLFERSPSWIKSVLISLAYNLLARSCSISRDSQLWVNLGITWLYLKNSETILKCKIFYYLQYDKVNRSEYNQHWKDNFYTHRSLACHAMGRTCGEAAVLARGREREKFGQESLWQFLYHGCLLRKRMGEAG